MGKGMRIFLFICFGLFVFVIMPFFGISIYAYMLSRDLPSVEEMSEFRYSEPMRVYDSGGKIIAELGQERRYPLLIDKMPKHVGQAVVSVEDARFYEHGGIDLLGIFRAFITNIKAGRTVEGGSTLTQQLVKIIYLSPEKKLKRKMKEAILAYRLDNYLPKDKILELYLNQVNFGRGAYGVQAAAINYFGKNVQDLTIAEAALIAGIPKAPSIFAPHINMQKSKDRRDHVLYRMFETGNINEEQYNNAINEEIVITDTIPLKLRHAGYFIDYVQKFVAEELAIDNPQARGLRIYTTLNVDHQIAAENAVKNNLIAVSKREGYLGVIGNINDNTSEIIDGKDTTVVKSANNLSLDKLPGYLSSLGIKKAQVFEVNQNNAKIELLDGFGVLKLEDNRWAVPVVKQESGQQETSRLKDFNKILKKGDVVYVSKKGKDGDNYILEQDPELEGALISINPKTGEIYAMVGGFHYEKSFFNRAVQAKRQTGSAFKPIVYATALENGVLPMDKILDVPIISEEDEEGNIWKPKNFEDKFYGPTTVKEALVKSRNVVTVKIAEKVGIKRIIRYAKEFGFGTDIPTDFSVALGSASASPLEMAIAFSTFANGGSRPEAPYFITKITTLDGQVLYEGFPPTMKNVLSLEATQMMNNMLMGAIEKGTGWKARVISRDVAGKTGTSNGSKDTWFAGYTPDLVAISWVGYDDFRKMGAYSTGSAAAIPQWVEYMKSVIGSMPYSTFPVSDNVSFFKVGLESRDITNSINDPYTFEPYPVDSNGNPIALRLNK